MLILYPLTKIKKLKNAAIYTDDGTESKLLRDNEMCESHFYLSVNRIWAMAVKPHGTIYWSIAYVKQTFIGPLKSLPQLAISANVCVGQTDKLKIQIL